MTARQIVIVGASLAGLRTAETLRDGGYEGALSIVGEEPHPPYDRPPLSKQVLSGWVRPDQTTLPRLRSIDAAWHLGDKAICLDRQARIVTTAAGNRLHFDHLVVATGARARRWHDPAGHALSGVLTLRTREDAAALVSAIDAGPRRILVIGAGFTGSEVASACHDRKIPVTVVEINPLPMLSALGVLGGAFFAKRFGEAGIDLRCGVAVARLLGDADGKVNGALLNDGKIIDADIVVLCLGARRNVEWLDDAGLDAGPDGLVCNRHCQALQADGAPAAGIFVAGDVARFRHPLANDRLVSLEHWGTAIDQARIAAANILAPESATTDAILPRFWSMQFGVGLKAVGLPACADEVAVVQGSVEDGRFVAAYGRAGRLVGIVAANHARWQTFYEDQIRAGSPFPPDYRAVDMPASFSPQPAGFPPAISLAA